MALSLGRWCPLVAGNFCYFADVSKIGQDSAGTPCLLSSFSLCLWRIACKYGSISRFKGVFSAVWGCCAGLCCLGALRGLWGFCVREWLGGFVACGVFAPVFHLLPISFCLSFYLFAPAFVLLSFFVLVVFCCSLSWFVFVVSFSLSDYTQKERAQVLASSLVLLCFPFQIYLMSLAKSKIILPFAVS